MATKTLPANEQYSLGEQQLKLTKVAFMNGFVFLAAGFSVGYLENDNLRRYLASYLMCFLFYFSISIGALFFVAFQHLCRAGWSVVIRRIAEVLAAALVPMSVLAIPFTVPVLFGHSGLFQWNSAEYLAEHPLVAGKAPYLNSLFFFIRAAIYFTIWILLARFYYLNSLKQDERKDNQITLNMQKFSAPALFLLAFSVTFASFDWIMSLAPEWFSTIFGVYFFAGCMVAFFASLPIIIVYLKSLGLLTNSITREHYQDIGKFLFGFIMFWAYIAFSQYLLIWYADIPEETVWYKVRQTGWWVGISLLLIFGHFIMPFLGLMNKAAKRNKGVLCAWCIFILIMHFIDLYWLIMPNVLGDRISFNLIDVLNFLGIGAIFAFSILKTVSNNNLIPVNDPRLSESLQFKNI